MDAVRCLDCADVRWSLMGIKGPTGRCAICGGETVPERRRPNGAPMARAERRHLAMARGGDREPSRPAA